MKIRQIQKLIILSLVLFVLLNFPILLLFDKPEGSVDYPLIYIYIFSIWAFGSIVSAYILNKFHE